VLVLDAVSVQVAPDFGCFWYAKHGCRCEVSRSHNVVRLFGTLEDGELGAGEWLALPEHISRDFVFHDIRLRNGAKLFYELKNSSASINMLCSTQVLTFHLGDHCSVKGFPSLPNEHGSWPRTLNVSLGYKSMFMGTTGCAVDNLNLHVRASPQQPPTKKPRKPTLSQSELDSLDGNPAKLTELKTCFVRRAFRAQVDTTDSLQVRIGALEGTAAAHQVVLADKVENKRWKPRITFQPTAPGSDERRAANQGSSVNTMRAQWAQWNRQTRSRVAAIRAATTARTRMLESVLELPTFPTEYYDKFGSEVPALMQEMEDAVQAYRRAVPPAASSSSSSSSSASLTSPRMVQQLSALASCVGSVVAELRADGQASEAAAIEQSFVSSSSSSSNKRKADDNCSSGVDITCMACHEADAQLFGEQCGHGYYCLGCDKNAAASLGVRYRNCPRCRVNNARLLSSPLPLPTTVNPCV
jgi:hypothetical protein